MSTTKQVTWWVATPTYPVTEYVCEFGGPTYDVADVVFVKGRTKSEALAAARPLLTHQPYAEGRRGDDLYPFTGLEAHPACCHHGVYMQSEDGEPFEECPACAYEDAAQLRSGFHDVW